MGRISEVPPHTHRHFLGLKKITYFNIYLHFTVIFTGLIRTTCSHSLPIFRYSEHVRIEAFIFQNNSELPPLPAPIPSVVSRLRLSQLVALNIFISKLSPPPPPYTHTHTHVFLANDAHVKFRCEWRKCNFKNI